MSPKLYMTQSSPPVRAVMMCAKAINLELHLVEINLMKLDHLQPEYIKINPLHTVPTLDDNGFVLCDSHAIMGYFIGKYSEDKSLYPEDVKKRALIDQRLYFDSGVLFTRLARMVHSVIFEGVKEIPEKLVKDVHEAYGFLETFLQDYTYVAGDDLSIADFSIINTISNANILVPMDEEEYPNISSWKKKMQTLPFYDINQLGSDMFRSIMKYLLKQ